MPLSEFLWRQHSHTAFGKLLRKPLRLIPRGTVLRIVRGPNKGCKWVTGSGNHAYWMGFYEYDKSQLMERAIPQGATVWDVGANVGYYSLMFSRLVGGSGKVYAFEPSPRNFGYLSRHIVMNHRYNVTIYPYALSDYNGTAAFEEHEINTTSQLSNAGNVTVPVRTLDDLITTGEVTSPHYMKIDVEGAELGVLRGSIQLLTIHRPLIFLATHGLHMFDQCCELLRTIGYVIEEIDVSGADYCWEVLARPGEQDDRSGMFPVFN